MSVDKFNAKAKLKKFKKQFIIGGGVVFVVVLVMVYSTDTQEAPPPEKIQSSQVYSAVKKLNPSTADVLMQQNEQQQLQQAQINQQLLQKINDLESQNQSYRQAAMEQESNTNALNDKLTKLNTTKIAASGAVGGAYTAQKPVKAVFEDDINSDGGDDSTFESSTQKLGQTPDNSSEKPSDIKSVATYLPSNTFIKGTLIVALSANTGGNADTTPTPFMVRLTDLARLPNEFRANLRSCMVGGSGFGDLSTERIKMRLTTLSCVLKNGQAIDIPVDGYVAGEDSKPGMRGMVITHSGTVAAKATLAGFVQGIGQIGQAMGQTQTITPLGGVTTTISPSQALTAGAGAGISQAGSNLSTYYMSMLQQISPSIEVTAGRHVTVVLTKGVELKLPINNQDMSNNSPMPIQ